MERPTHERGASWLEYGQEMEQYADYLEARDVEWISCANGLESRIQKYKYILACMKSEILTQYSEQRVLETMMQELNNE